MYNPSQAYENLKRDTLSGRELEASILLRAAQKLNKCAQAWTEPRTREFQDRLDEALGYNQKLWTFLQVELANPENPLPAPLRMDLLRLSRYIDRTTFQLFSGGAAQDLRSLCTINQEVASGLMVNANAFEPGDPTTDISETTKIDVSA